MTYAKIENGVVVEYPVAEGDIRLLYPNCSFPTPFVAPDGYELVQHSQFPTFDYTKNISEGMPLLTDGVWTQNWVVAGASPSEIEARTEQQWMSVRGERNTLLAECDWTQLPDAPLTNTQTTEWATYRQALRDITDQADPFSITWPTKPE
jgi:hypothetical protein